MQLSDWLVAIGVGIVIGILGRLIIPGKQRIGVFVTLIIGVVSFLLGALVGNWVGLDHHAHVSVWRVSWSWAVFGLQVGIAVVLTAIAAAITHTRVASSDAPAKKPARSAKKKTPAKAAR